MTKKNLFTLVLCLFCLGTTTHAQHIPTLEEAVYGGLIKTEVLCISVPKQLCLSRI